MTTRRRLTTKAQAVRAFRELLAACDMSGEEYVAVLLRLSELARDLADDEVIVERIYALQAAERAATRLRQLPRDARLSRE